MLRAAGLLIAIAASAHAVEIHIQFGALPPR
jgi:hypothetical protein